MCPGFLGGAGEGFEGGEVGLGEVGGVGACGYHCMVEGGLRSLGLTH